MTKEFTENDALRLANENGLQLAASFSSLRAPTEWICGQGHQFHLSANSLKRRIRDGTGACPSCNDAARANHRIATEFAKVVEGAKANGLTVLSTQKEYTNQNSPMRVTCDQCATCTARPILALKLARKKSCAVLGRQRQAKARRLTGEDVASLVALHPMGLTLISDPTAYINNRSPIQVRCVNGHVYDTTVSDLQRRDRLRGCPLCAERTGQSAMTAILAGLLGVPAEVEITPDFLQADWPQERGPLRLDAYYKDVPVGAARWNIAAEYHGAQHFDPEHHYHQQSCHGAEVAYRRLQQGDRHKVAACAAQPNVVLLVLVDREVGGSLQRLLTDVTAALEYALPTIADDHDYQTRKRSLMDPDVLDGHLRERAVAHSTVTRLRAQLESRGADLISFDPISRRAACRCRCGTPWETKANNLLNGVSTDRRGTACPVCSPKARGRKRRLSEQSVIARAGHFGWLPLWLSGSYSGQTQKLDWGCATPSCLGRLHSDFDHLQRGRVCPVCKSANAPSARVKKGPKRDRRLILADKESE
jgi:hypothetical protein